MPTRERRHGEGLLSAAAVGAVFILIGIVFITTPNLINDAREFFSDFTTLQVPNTSIQLPAPAHPANHAALYGAMAQFTLGISILQILMLGIKACFAVADKKDCGNRWKPRFLVRSHLPHNHASQRCNNCRDVVYVLGCDTGDLGSIDDS